MRMTYDTGDQIQASNSRTVQVAPTGDGFVSESPTLEPASYKSNETVEATIKQTPSPPPPHPTKTTTPPPPPPEAQREQSDDSAIANCYNPVLDDEIRSRLDKLNALSDLINSLERQFDEANSLFREILKCSTDRLSNIAKTLGSKSIRQGRLYHAARLSVEQSQTDCQRACVQFEQANEEHQSAKKAIQNAESKLRQIAGESVNGVIAIPNANFHSIDLSKLTLTNGNESQDDESRDNCDREGQTPSNSTTPTPKRTNQQEVTSTTKQATNEIDSASNEFEVNSKLDAQLTEDRKVAYTNVSDEIDNPPSAAAVTDAAKLGEELNQAILKLFEAEKKRGQSEQLHLDQASKLMMAQENLMKLGREHGQSIKRSQLYFDEARRFDAKLNSVKADICRISEDILNAKQAYAQTLKELEQFSDDLHVNSQVLVG